MTLFALAALYLDTGCKYFDIANVEQSYFGTYRTDALVSDQGWKRHPLPADSNFPELLHMVFTGKDKADSPVR
jgi:hypothetical protein